MNIGKQLRSSKAGMSLVEVMVSLSILGVVTMGALAIGDQVANQSRMNRTGNNIYQLHESIRSRTFMAQDCTQFLGNENATVPLNFQFNKAKKTGVGPGQKGLPISIVVPNARGLAGVPISAAAGLNDLTTLGLQVKSLDLTNAIYIDDGDPGPPQRYLAYVEMELDKTAASPILGGKGFLRKRIVSSLYFETSAPNKNAPAAIDTCRSASSDIDKQELCVGLGDAFYWDATNQICVPPAEPLACVAGTVLVAVEGGVAICEPLGIEGQKCDPGEFIVSLGIGHMFCEEPGTVVEAIPADPPCPPQVVNWGAGCSSSEMVLPLTETAQLDLTDPAPDPAGTVKVTCVGGSLVQSAAVCNVPPTPTPPPPFCASGYRRRNGETTWLGAAACAAAPGGTKSCMAAQAWGACCTAADKALDDVALNWCSPGVGAAACSLGPGVGHIGSGPGKCQVDLTTSDARLKKNIKWVAFENGFNIYEYNYVDELKSFDHGGKTYRGVMAQEVLLTKPEAVVSKNGHLAVRYDLLGVKFEVAHE